MDVNPPLCGDTELPARFTIGLGHVLWLALIPPVALLALNHVISLDNVRKDSIALQKELERSRITPQLRARSHSQKYLCIQ